MFLLADLSISPLVFFTELMTDYFLCVRESIEGGASQMRAAAARAEGNNPPADPSHEDTAHSAASIFSGIFAAGDA